MRVKRCFSIAMLAVGTVIGAGFASGAEIVSFFGNRGISPFAALLCLPLIFGGCLLFLYLGSRFKPKDITALNRLCCGKFARAFDFFLLVNAFIVLAGMLAAFDSLSRDLMGFPMLSVVFGILAAIIVTRGIGGIIRLNALILPAVIVLLVAVCAGSINKSFLDCEILRISPIAAVLYVSMNLILAAGALTSVHDLKPSETVLSSAIASAVIGVLMSVIIFALNSTAKFSGALPTLEMAREIHPALHIGMVVALSASIFTTLLTAMNCLTDYAATLTKKRGSAAAVVLIIGLALSLLGFERVVSFLYPVIGVIGVVYIAANAVTAVRCARRGKAKLSGGKKHAFRLKRRRDT